MSNEKEKLKVRQELLERLHLEIMERVHTNSDVATELARIYDVLEEAEYKLVILSNRFAFSDELDSLDGRIPKILSKAGQALTGVLYDLMVGAIPLVARKTEE